MLVATGTLPVRNVLPGMVRKVDGTVGDGFWLGRYTVLLSATYGDAASNLSHEPLFGSSLGASSGPGLFSCWSPSHSSSLSEIGSALGIEPQIRCRLSDASGLEHLAVAHFGGHGSLTYNQTLMGYSLPLRPDFVWRRGEQPLAAFDAKFRLRHAMTCRAVTPRPGPRSVQGARLPRCSRTAVGAGRVCRATWMSITMWVHPVSPWDWRKCSTDHSRALAPWPDGRERARHWLPPGRRLLNAAPRASEGRCHLRASTSRIGAGRREGGSHGGRL